MLCLDFNQRPKDQKPYYEVSLDVRGTDLGDKYDCCFLNKYFYSKKDALKFIEKNGNPFDTFYLDFVPHSSKKKGYSQHGTIISSFNPGNRSGKDICLSSKEVF